MAELEAVDHSASVGAMDEFMSKAIQELVSAAEAGYPTDVILQLLCAAATAHPAVASASVKLIGAGSPVARSSPAWSSASEPPSDADDHVLTIDITSHNRPWARLELLRDPDSIFDEPHIAALRVLAKAAGGFSSLASDRGRTEVSLRDMAHRATHDELTALPNRAMLRDRLTHALKASARNGRAVGLMFIDVDDFKQINDELGHQAGDMILVEIARRLGNVLRTCDTLVRFSGDEFVVVCEGLDGEAAASTKWLTTMARRLQHELRRPPEPGEVEVVVSISVGIVVADQEATAASLIHDADSAMYRAKRVGPGRVHIAQPGDQPMISPRQPRSGRGRLRAL